MAMPSYRIKQKDKDGKTVYKDICFPVTKEFREKLYGEIVGGNNETKEKKSSSSKDVFRTVGEVELNQFNMRKGLK